MYSCKCASTCESIWKKRERGREKKSAQSIFIYFVHIDFLVDFSSLFAASINTYWSVYSRNKIHLTSNECRSIPGLNDFFSENLASHWTAPDLHADIFCIYTQFRCVRVRVLYSHRIVYGRLFDVGSRLFSLYSIFRLNLYSMNGVFSLSIGGWATVFTMLTNA